MRAAVRPAALATKWITLSRPAQAVPSGPTNPFPLLPSLRFLTTTSSGRATWPLQDLPRVSERKSPLVFHLTSDNPYHNLSIEHYLLTKSHPESRILLFYTNRPCVVLGRNQNPWLETGVKTLQQGPPRVEQNRALPAGTPALRAQHESDTREPIDLVRRRSGGGTVFHDSGNLNYSVIVPNGNTMSFKRSTHAEMVVRALTGLHDSNASRSPYRFREVRVNDRHDIIMQRPNESAWLKVSGSAYKLTRGRALHHGTLLVSSPYIDHISEVLRSPGRDLIQAMGVESVRSKVGNLARLADAHGRNAMRQEITERVIREFWAMYSQGADQQRETGVNEVTLDASEVEEDKNPEIAAGVRELESDAWRFEQTPRFHFTSGVLGGVQVAFQANRGVLDTVSLQQDSRMLEINLRKIRGAPKLKLHEVDDWRRLLASFVTDQGEAFSTVDIPDALVQRIEAIFPRARHNDV